VERGWGLPEGHRLRNTNWCQHLEQKWMIKYALYDSKTPHMHRKSRSARHEVPLSRWGTLLGSRRTTTGSCAGTSSEVALPGPSSCALVSSSIPSARSTSDGDATGPFSRPVPAIMSQYLQSR
jgi:hypothetical protein